MSLNTELILTLKHLKGFGNKTVLNVAESVPSGIETVEDLCTFWETLTGKKYRKYTTEDLLGAHKAALKTIRQAEENGVGIMSYYDDCFPQILRETVNEEGREDAPVILFYRGNLAALQKPAIAMVGTREPTMAGEKAGRFFAEKFAKEGYNIVSGLAIGCDTVGHRGTLDAAGTTTAFLATGLDWDSVYPKESLDLAKEIVERGGLLLSEYPVGQAGNPYTLIARDRLQAGLSYATIVIQTGIKGGTMHAVGATLNAKKPLFAVKYKRIEEQNGERAEGNRRLLEEGKAHPLASATLDEAFSLVQASIERINQPKQKSSLF